MAKASRTVLMNQAIVDLAPMQGQTDGLLLAVAHRLAGWFISRNSDESDLARRSLRACVKSEPHPLIWRRKGYETRKIPHRSDRCPVVARPAPDSQAQTGRAAAVRRPARNPQRHLLSRPRRHPVADASPRLSPMGNGPLLLSAMASRWHVGGDPERPADQVRHKAGRHKSPRRHHRQPNREDDRDEAPAATTRASESRDVNGTSWLIPWFAVALVVHSAGIQYPAGAKLVLAKIVGRFPRLRLIWTDGTYQPVVGWAKSFGG